MAVGGGGDAGVGDGDGYGAAVAAACERHGGECWCVWLVGRGGLVLLRGMRILQFGADVCVFTFELESTESLGTI